MKQAERPSPLHLLHSDADLTSSYAGRLEPSVLIVLKLVAILIPTRVFSRVPVSRSCLHSIQNFIQKLLFASVILSPVHAPII